LLKIVPRIVSPALALLIASQGLSAQASKRRVQQTENQLDSSPTLFAVLAAVNAAGYDADINSPTNHPLRQAIRQELGSKDLESLRNLKRFVSTHRQNNSTAEFSQYVSYGLSVVGPPTFELIHPELQPPPDVAALDGLTPLLVAFYKDVNFNDLWKRAQPYYDQALEPLHEPVSRAVLMVNSYMRNPTMGYLGRRFQIYIELLGPPNQVQTRSYGDDTFVVVTPAVDLPIDQIRHAYLHYLSDPLCLKYASQLYEKRALGDFAMGSPILEDAYKNDFTLLALECFIKAVESRIDHKPALVDLALKEGFVVTPAFAEQLDIYEKQEQAMRGYFPNIVDGIDLKREETRLDRIEFASRRAVKTHTVTSVEKPPALSGAAKVLDDAEAAYLNRDLAKAKQGFADVLKLTDQKSLHARAYYGLARIAALERDPELADKLFRKVVELDPDGSTKAWSLLYLGRLADSQGRREEAQQFYRDATQVPGAPDSVRQAAEKGIQEAFTAPPKKN